MASYGGVVATYKILASEVGAGSSTDSLKDIFVLNNMKKIASFILAIASVASATVLWDGRFNDYSYVLDTPLVALLDPNSQNCR